MRLGPSMKIFEPPQHVIEAYNEPHRKYHNLDHIESILNKIPLFIEAYDLKDIHVTVLQYMTWYHDVVYVPGRSDNEIESARMYADAKGKPFGSGQRVIDTILFTGNIPASNHKMHTNPPTFFSAIFFDLDLADMGTESYVENSFKIREEFGEFSDLEWLAGRQKFLSDFLSRPFIYHTSLGYKLWEERARFNMNMELSYLKGKYGD